MTTQTVSQERDSFECRLLNSRFSPVLIFPVDAASTNAATRCASAILQHALAGQRDLVGFELRRNGVRVLTCLESFRTAALALSTEVGENPHGSCSVF